MKSNRIVLLLALAVLLWSLRCASDDTRRAGEGSDRVGRVSFPISCRPEAQATFNQAIAWLHSFEYEEAQKAFQEAARQDPQCSMAHWGLAMSLYHQLWDHPGSDTLEEGRAELQKARELGPKTPREQEYIDAASAFFGKMTHPVGTAGSDPAEYLVRATTYSKAMEHLCSHYPQDDEAGAFYALSLLASYPPDDPTLSNPKKAIAILQRLFAKEPDHPGLAHYLIHAADFPQLAPLGLEAARRYAKIAPSSPHALHMPSHIFTRLGLWQESIESNIASAAAAQEPMAIQMGGSGHATHAMDFLQYAYLQRGQDADARRLIKEVTAIQGTRPDELAFIVAKLEARYVLETHDWKLAARITAPPDAGLGLRAMAQWARTIGAARSGDPAGARKEFGEFEAIRTKMLGDRQEYGSHPYTAAYEEASAWVAYAVGKKDDALKTLRAAADHQDEGGVDDLTMPVREALGDLQLELKQPSQALESYEAALKEAPNRFDSLFGAARAAQLSGNLEKARGFYTKLAVICKGSDSDRVELRQARAFLAAERA